MLDDLPSELLHRVFSHLSCTENAAVRLVCRNLNTHAVAHTFSAAWIHDSDSAAADNPAYRALSTHPSLAQHVSHLTIQTHPIPRDLPALLLPVGAGAFPRLRSVTVAFPGGVVYGPSSFQDGYGLPSYSQPWDHRAEVLTAIFAALATCATVRALTLLNLQDYHTPAVEPFLAPVLARLHALHLGVLSEHTGTLDDYAHAELFDFYARLPALWLAHCQPHLRALSLAAHDFFGYLPPLDLRSLRFPALRRLEMVNWSISHEWQVAEFLTAAALPELRELRLLQCPIVFGAKVGAPLAAEGYPMLGHNTGHTDDEAVVRFDRRWAWVFDSLRTALPKLVRLCVAATAWDEWVEDDDDGSCPADGDGDGQATPAWLASLGVWRDVVAEREREGVACDWDAWLGTLDVLYVDARLHEDYGSWYNVYDEEWKLEFDDDGLDVAVPRPVFGREDREALVWLVGAVEERRRRGDAAEGGWRAGRHRRWTFGSAWA
ncbi:hypothetical protein EDC01DRAFT_645657 [Geopyxis carbonaria]|nr:hypothetical protein EDC01DRAFT_645657 [Geopyxis carbonaria]